MLCIVRRGPSERRGIVHARLLGRQERSFQVDAENARVGGNDLLRGIERGAHLGRRVADQSWQQCRRSEVPMRADDGRNPIRRWTVVEQDIAAAVHLDVDEAGREPGASRQNTGRYGRRQLRPMEERCDARSFDHDRAIRVHAGAVENAVGDHRVSV